MSISLTLGVHHVGLAVPDLDAAVSFFCTALCWTDLGRNDAYPAAFVSDGLVTVTLWRVADPEQAVAFDRRRNIGLHHLAIAVADETMLAVVFDRVKDHPGVTVEFEPGPIRPNATTHHFICAMPGGARIEFATRAG